MKFEIIIIIISLIRQMLTISTGQNWNLINNLINHDIGNFVYENDFNENNQMGSREYSVTYKMKNDVNKVMVFGGLQSGTGNILGDMWNIDLSTGYVKFINHSLSNFYRVNIKPQYQDLKQSVWRGDIHPGGRFMHCGFSSNDLELINGNNEELYYIFGGFVFELEPNIYGPSNDLWAYSPIKSETPWNLLKFFNSTGPKKVGGHTCTPYKRLSDGKTSILIFGGGNDFDQTYSSLWEVKGGIEFTDTETQNYYFTFNLIYGEEGLYKNNVDVDVDTNNYHDDNKIGARYKHMAWQIGDELYIFGGRTMTGGMGSYYNSLWKFNLRFKQWKKLYGNYYDEYEGQPSTTDTDPTIESKNNGPGVTFDASCTFIVGPYIAFFGGYEKVDVSYPKITRNFWYFNIFKKQWKLGDTLIVYESPPDKTNNLVGSMAASSCVHLNKDEIEGLTVNNIDNVELIMVGGYGDDEMAMATFSSLDSIWGASVSYPVGDCECNKYGRCFYNSQTSTAECRCFESFEVSDSQQCSTEEHPMCDGVVATTGNKAGGCKSNGECIADETCFCGTVSFNDPTNFCASFNLFSLNLFGFDFLEVGGIFTIFAGIIGFILLIIISFIVCRRRAKVRDNANFIEKEMISKTKKNGGGGGDDDNDDKGDFIPFEIENKVEKKKVQETDLKKESAPDITTPTVVDITPNIMSKSAMNNDIVSLKDTQGGGESKINIEKGQFDTKLSELLIDRKELDFQKLLGKGSYGIVLKCKWKGRGGGIEVALKEMNFINDINTLKEIITLSSLNHPNIVKIFGYTIDKNKKCSMVLEYVDGGSLFDYLHPSGPEAKLKFSKQKLDWIDKWNLCKQMVVSINYLHNGKSISVLHRDIKSANFLVTRDLKSLKLADFGMSKLHISEEAVIQNTTQTKIGNVGTSRWKAPETIGSRRQKDKLVYDEKSDIYSLGLTIFEIITERIPFDNLNEEMEICFDIKDGIRPDIKSKHKNVKIPEIFNEIIKKCWENDPQKRPNAVELLNFIEKNEKRFLEKYRNLSEKFQENVETSKLLTELMTIGKTDIISQQLEDIEIFLIENFLNISENETKYNPIFIVNNLCEMLVDKNLIYFNDLEEKVKVTFFRVLSRFLDLTLLKNTKTKKITDYEGFQMNTIQIIDKFQTLIHNESSSKVSNILMNEIRYLTIFIKEALKNFKTNEEAFASILGFLTKLDQVGELYDKLVLEISKNPKKWYMSVSVLRFQSYSIISGDNKDTAKFFSKIKVSKKDEVNYGIVEVLSTIVRCSNKMDTRTQALNILRKFSIQVGSKELKDILLKEIEICERSLKE